MEDASGREVPVPWESGMHESGEREVCVRGENDTDADDELYDVRAWKSV